VVPAKRVQPLTSTEQTTLVRVGNQSWRIGPDSSDDLQMPNGSQAPFINAGPLTRSAVSLQIKSVDQRSKGLRGVIQLFLKSIVVIQSFVERVGKWLSQSVNRQVKRIPQTFRDSFQIGAIFGLALGCLSLFFFHQMQPSASAESTPKVSSLSPSTGVNVPVPVPVPSHSGIQVPGFTFYSLKFGQFANKEEATRLEQKLRQTGLGVRLEVSHGSWSVLSSIAVQANDLLPLAHKYSIWKPQIYRMTQMSQVIPVLATTSMTTANKTEQWLSVEGSALLALTAVVSDGENLSDAKAAYANQQRLYPGDDMIATTGLSMWVVELSQQMAIAYSAAMNHQTQTAQAALERAQAMFTLLAQTP
jgi:hypothetical protein